MKAKDLFSFSSSERRVGLCLGIGFIFICVFNFSLGGLDCLLYLAVILHPHHLEETLKVDILLDNVATLHAWTSDVKQGLAMPCLTVVFK